MPCPLAPAPATPDSIACHSGSAAVRMEGEARAVVIRAVRSWAAAGLCLSRLAQAAAESAAPASSLHAISAPCSCTSAVACWHSCSSFCSSRCVGACPAPLNFAASSHNAATAGCRLPAPLPRSAVPLTDALLSSNPGPDLLRPAGLCMPPERLPAGGWPAPPGSLGAAGAAVAMLRLGSAAAWDGRGGVGPLLRGPEGSGLPLPSCQSLLLPAAGLER